MIVRPDADIIAYSNFFEYIGIDQFHSPNGYIPYEDANGTPKYAFFKELEETGFFAVISVDEKDLHAPVSRIFTNNLIVFIATLVLCIFIIYALIKSTLKPVSVLIEGMKKAEDGEYTLQIPTNRSDEIAEIAI